MKTLRSFVAQDKYHYITLLDENQFNERKVKYIGERSRYQYGDATLHEIDIELMDSKERGYLISSRGIKINWDNGKMTIALTSLPREIIDASEVVNAYFRRWPAQELQFKSAKAVASLNRVSGYGRKQILNEGIREKQLKIAEKIKAMTNNLRIPIKKISSHEQAIARLIPEERKLLDKCTIKNGERQIPMDLRVRIEKFNHQIKGHKVSIAQVTKTHKKDLNNLFKNKKEWLRLQGKERVYEIDVELDQILTYHRVSLIICILLQRVSLWNNNEYDYVSS